LDQDFYPYKRGADRLPDPKTYGENIADLAISEPFGADSFESTADADGVYWFRHRNG
jgi:hypothetical protein